MMSHRNESSTRDESSHPFVSLLEMSHHSLLQHMMQASTLYYNIMSHRYESSLQMMSHHVPEHSPLNHSFKMTLKIYQHDLNVTRL